MTKLFILIISLGAVLNPHRLYDLYRSHLFNDYLRESDQDPVRVEYKLLIYNLLLSLLILLLFLLLINAIVNLKVVCLLLLLMRSSRKRP